MPVIVRLSGSIKLKIGTTKLRRSNHAWNSVYIGKWISVDALFNQIPADVTHLRFAGGSKHLPMDLVGLIGKVKIHIMELDG